MAVRQRDASHGHALRPETPRYLLRRRLSASIGVGIKGQIYHPRAIAQLEKLACIQMIPQGTSDVMEACLPYHREVEQSFHENNLRGAPDLLPRIQSALTGRQKSMRRHRIQDAAAIEIILQWKDDAE